MTEAMRGANAAASAADEAAVVKDQAASDYASFVPPASSAFPVWILVVVALLLAGALGFFLVF